MDKTLARSPATENQDHKMNSGHATPFSVRDENFDFNSEESLKENRISEANKQNSENCAPITIPKESVEKPSPTLLESAFNVMRNLFSPEKSKNKSANSVDQHKTMPESKNEIVHMPNKPKDVTLDQGIEITIAKSPLSEELSILDKKQLNKPLLSPLPYDLISSADDSFLTTVSQIDESFQSAVTHLDENGEMTRNITNSIFNSSQNLDSGDSCNSSFENSECCLENTMLKNEAATPNEINHNQSVEHKNKINGVQNSADVEPPSVDLTDGSIQPDSLEIESSLKTSNEFTEVDVVVANSIEDKNDSHEFGPIIVVNDSEEILEHQVLPVIEHVTPQPPQCLSNNFVKTINENKNDENVNCDVVKNEAANELTAEEISQNGVNNTAAHLTNDDLNEVDEMLVVLQKQDIPPPSLDVINGNVNLIDSGNGIDEMMAVLQNQHIMAPSLNVINSNGNLIDSGNGMECSASPIEKSAEKISPQERHFSPIRSDGYEAENDDAKQMKPFLDLSLVTHPDETSVESHEDLVELKISENFTNGVKDDKRNEFGPEIQKSYTVLSVDSNLKRPVVNSSPDVNANNSFNLIPTHNEDAQNDGATVSPVDLTSIFTLKHSTPVLNGGNCMDGQNLEMNSLEINPHVNSPVENQKESCSSLTDELKPEEFTAVALDKQEINNSKEKSPPCNRLNITYDMKPKEEPPGFDETFVKSLDSSKGELKESIMNKTYDKEPDKHNLTYCKTDASEVQKNNTPVNELNNTYVKEVNKILEKNLAQGFLNDKERSGCSEFQEMKHFLSPIKEPDEPVSQIPCISLNEVMEENIDGYKSIDAITYTEGNHSFLSGASSTSPAASDTSVVKNQKPTLSNTPIEDLSGKLEQIHLNEFPREFLDKPEPLPGESKSAGETAPEFFSKNDEAELAKFIEQQFTPTDIDKICDAAGFTENVNFEFVKPNDVKVESILSPKGFEFLSSIQGKPTGRDLSRESLYVKFDPLVQPPSANSLIDFTKEVQALEATEAPPADLNSSICEELLSISPEKKSNEIVPPLTPLSDRSKLNKTERIKELQNEIYFLKNLYAERERSNKAKMDEYENKIAKLTADKCVYEDQLKEYGEREKSLVKKMTTQSEGIERLKNVLEEYIVTLTNIGSERDALKVEKQQQTEALTAERDWYMKHLQNTEAAFTDVHSKYEKSKKTIESLKANAAQYERLIAEYNQKEEMFEKAFIKYKADKESELENVLKQLHKTENIHNQEVARLRAQLKKTELKLEAMQESLDQKIKENQQLTAICDELIEGKKEIRK